MLPGNPQPRKTSLLLFIYEMKNLLHHSTYPAYAQIVCHCYQSQTYIPLHIHLILLHQYHTITISLRDNNTAVHQTGVLCTNDIILKIQTFILKLPITKKVIHTSTHFGTTWDTKC